MKLLMRSVAFALIAALSACGGGGGSSGSNGSGNGGTTTPAAASIEVLTSAATLASGDSAGLTVTAVVKDASNNAIPSQPIAFSASSGTLASVEAQTGTDGRATATLTAGTDRSNRNVDIIVTSGSIKQNATVPVTGTTLTASGATSLLAGASTSFAVSVRDSAGVAIAGAAVTATSSLGNTVGATGATTDANGSATLNYVAARGGSDTLSIRAAGASQILAVNVSSVDFSFPSPAANTAVEVNTSRSVTVRYLSAGAGVAGKTISFGTTRGSVTPTQAVTDASGSATVQVTSPSVGIATVSARVDDSATATLPLNFVATTAASVVLQSSAAALAPNAAGSTASQIELRAVVRDAAGNAVSGKTVFFTAVQDLSNGSIKTGTAVTDANGLATDIFIAGPAATAANGVQIRATVADTAITALTSLTVSSRALFIAFGANNTIEKLSTTYRKTFSVQVSDANGAPVPNQRLTLSYWAPIYEKGQLFFDKDGTPPSWKANATVACVNEDANRNGVLDAGEDRSGDGRLTPGLPATISPATVTTDATGSAEFTLTYGQQYANWIYFDLTAQATVAGTESSALFGFAASAPASDMTSADVPPASSVSPFGSVLSCTDRN